MQKYKDKIKQLIPQKLIYYYYLQLAKKTVLPDLKRRVYDKVYNNSDTEKVQRDLTLLYHIVEKGLTMPVPRPGFGKKVVLDLCCVIEQHEKMNLSVNNMEFCQSVSVLREYSEFHKKISFALDAEVNENLSRILNKFKHIYGVEQLQLSKTDYFKDIHKSFDIFSRSRYSVRNYTNEQIPLSVLYDCIELAQKSPSFCNRQPTRVHIVKSTVQKQDILELQNGNRGFGHLAETLLVITSVISTTKDIHERNENHLNGGIFIMTLLNALHFNRIGACSLNWSVSNDKDEKLRKLINSPENEVILMIISCGFLPDEISLASSPRKTAREISTVH